MEVKICKPLTKEEFKKYYDLRWKVLRKPWKQPKGSEKDEREKESIPLSFKEITILAIFTIGF